MAWRLVLGQRYTGGRVCSLPPSTSRPERRYNDHHFHYGYFLYAAAVVGKTDPAWLKEWAPAFSHMIRDIANPSADDPLYPYAPFPFPASVCRPRAAHRRCGSDGGGTAPA